jgi:hypothetical protein
MRQVKQGGSKVSRYRPGQALWDRIQNLRDEHGVDVIYRTSRESDAPYEVDLLQAGLTVSRHTNDDMAYDAYVQEFIQSLEKAYEGGYHWPVGLEIKVAQAEQALR